MFNAIECAIHIHPLLAFNDIIWRWFFCRRDNQVVPKILFDCNGPTIKHFIVNKILKEIIKKIINKNVHLHMNNIHINIKL